MATINGCGNSLLDKILPTYGNERINTPIWNESQHMFITDQYTSAAGNTYYIGIRFTDRFVQILHIGLFHNFTYINDIEVYVFNGTERQLVGKKTLDVYYDEDLIRSTTEKMLHDYVVGQLKLTESNCDLKQIENQVKETVKASYFSLIDTPNIHTRMESIKPLLESKKNECNQWKRIS